MLSIAVNKVCRVIVLSTALLSGIACAEGPRGPIAPVAAMYRHFAWEALSSDTEAFGNGLAAQSARALSQYFEPRLAKMIADDAACQSRTQAFCKLDFDILFDSQDPQVVDLSIAAGPSNTVDVRFKDPVTADETRITYTVSRQASGWRISNATYVKGSRRSLRSIFEGASTPQV